MQSITRRLHGKPIHIIHPGEHFETGDDIAIGTLLGSCIAVAMYDPQTGVGGLNHFLLPNLRDPNVDYKSDDAGRYGVYAMAVLFNGLYALGARRKNLRAKVFGGGHVLHGTSSGNVPESNIEFAFEFLENEHIPVESHDVGGVQARKVYLFPASGKVLMKRFGGPRANSVEQGELSYLSKLRSFNPKGTGARPNRPRNATSRPPGQMQMPPKRVATHR